MEQNLVKRFLLFSVVATADKMRIIQPKQNTKLFFNFKKKKKKKKKKFFF